MGASASFLEERSLAHLKRLLMTQFLLQKKIEKSYRRQKSQFLVKIFSVDSILCIAAFYPKQENTLADRTILKVASQKVPALVKIVSSYYQWEDRSLSYTFSYVELEKMRGKKLGVSEVKELEKYLKAELHHYLVAPSIFWPYNHEEAFKQLLILAKEISSKKDYPQVSIHFQKQTADDLEFIIYLARPKAKSEAITESCFPPSAHWVAHIKREFEAHIPTLIEAFSIRIPIENYKKRSEVNLLRAREFIAKLLESAIGIFRDYNGGLFETQKTRFEELSRLFSGKIPNFSGFAEDLFYALMPIEAQMSLDDFAFEKLFEGFSQILNSKAHFLNQPNPHVAIFKSQNFDKINPYLKQAKDLQKQERMIAFANIKVCSTHYLCLITKKKNFLKTFGIKQVKENNSTLKQRVLRLAFQAGEIPSLCNFYLFRETRGRTIANFLFEGLVRISPKGEIKYTGCSKVTLSENKTRYLFKIRRHYWSNGQKVTAFQYESTWKKNFFKEKDLDLFYIIKNADAIKNGEKTIQSLGIKALAEDILQVDLEREDPNFLRKLKHPIFFPSLGETFEIRGFNGPYSLCRKIDQTLILETNPYYWDKDNTFFNKVIIYFECCPRKIHYLFKNNKIDWIGNPCTYCVKVSNALTKREVPYPLLIYLNTRVFPLSSTLIRRALSYVIDRGVIAKNIFPGNTQLYTPLPQNLSFCTSPCTNYDVQKAKKLFKQGMENLGLTKETFPSLEISSCDQEGHRKLAKYLQESWQDNFGIRISLNVQSWNVFYQKFDQGNFQIGGFFKCLLDLDPILFLESFSRKKGNFSHWMHQDYTEIIRSIKQTDSLKLRAQYLEKAENFLVAHMPVIPLLSLVYSYTHKMGLRDYVIDQAGSIDFRYASIQSMPNANREGLSGQSKALLNEKDKNDTERD